MKTITILVLGILLTASPLFAAGITDATKPLGHLKLSIGAEGNFVFERDIEKPENRSKFELEDINQVYGKVAVGLTPYFNVYAKLGASDNGEIKDNNLSVGNDLKIETDHGFLWGVGISGAREVWEGWKIGLDAQFNRWESDVEEITSDGVKATNISGEIENLEFQGTPFITRKFDLMTNWAINPYLGVKISGFKTATDNIKYTAGSVNKIDSWSLKGDENVGIVVGTDVEFYKNWTFQVEGRFIDETAVTGGGTYKF